MPLGLRTVGRAPANLTCTVEGDVTEDDLAMLREPRGADAAPSIVKLRERHHALARLIAEGKTPGEAALLTRYSQSRVSILQSDPAFQELVAHYRTNVNAEFVDFQRKLSELAIDAAHVLQERLEEEPDELSDSLLLRVVEVGADRTGHGPSAKQEMNIRIGLADRLRDARERSEAVRQVEGPKTIDAVAERPRPHESKAERPRPTHHVSAGAEGPRLGATPAIEGAKRGGGDA